MIFISLIRLSEIKFIRVHSECGYSQGVQNFFKPEDGHYKPVRIGNAFSSNQTDCKGDGDKDKALLIKDYLDEVKPYLSDIINNCKTQG